ncbi:hypothetical protein QBZ16_004783 [Prototheca wickerhamii]|uniref:Methyltransferase type 11 domain-containing protein n=1 Tax=Prototheca wickerhamii TaxID=3111 RepID=A0AAD9IF01_PROWI|nr:hypothetical protein QBZ16_004783 [Prototheca wickerhamii]
MAVDDNTAPSAPQDALKAGIAKLYDESESLWETLWGDHLHHGYYEPGAPVPADRRQPQVDMVDRVCDWAGIQSVKEGIDIGCGVGGSSRHILERYPGSRMTGITLSPVQAARAGELTAQAGLGSRAEFQVADALDQPFESGRFDLVWSLESGEHMPDKERFVREMVRVGKPGGKVVLVTWCHRNLEPGEKALTAWEQRLLRLISRVYYLPPWCSLDDYRRIFDELKIQDVKTDDWSVYVKPFWGEVIKSSFSMQAVKCLFKAGMATFKVTDGALVMPLMALGLRQGTIRFVLISGTIPETR